MKKPTNESEFHNFILEIDAILKAKNIPIQQRPLHAFREIALRLSVELKVTGVGQPVPGNYEGDSFSAHILKWYDEKYGDRLKIDYAPAYVVILIQGDPYRLKIPLVYGSGKFIFDENFKKRPTIVVGSKNKKPAPLLINVYELIDGLTKKMAKSLTLEDKKEIMDFVTESYDSIYKLIEMKDLPFKKEAMADLKAAVDNILIENTNYGFSKWSSLQFTEKILKGFLKKNKINFPKKHDLVELNNLLTANNLPHVQLSVIGKIQCYAEVRYNKQLIDRNDAIKAHNASLEALQCLLQGSFTHIRKNY